MSDPLWSIVELAGAAAGRVEVGADDAPPSAITGISIDTRSIQPGELFVALKDRRDGHDFVATAFAMGAAAALVSESYVRQADDGLLIRVDDVLAALEKIGVAARARLGREARVIAVTGSAGKTTAKEMLRLCLTPQGPTHASDKSFNNHWGVPLTLARMPAATRYAIFEIGMNHAGEITPLTRMVRPDIAIITTVEAAHLAAFASVEDIARAKSEILLGLEPGGWAVLNRDNPHYALLRRAALDRSGVNVVSFGTSEVPLGDGEGSITLATATTNDGVTAMAARIGSGAEVRDISIRMNAAGHHMVMNALAVLAAVAAAGAQLSDAAAALAAFGPPSGRGSRQTVSIGDGGVLLIDESYNANPASMRAALLTMETLPRAIHPRRIAILGDMLELGSEARRLHEQVAETIDRAGIDLVFAAGPQMKHLFTLLPAERQGQWSETSSGLEERVLKTLQPGDAVMVKGSNGSRMGLLVDLIRALEKRAA